MSEVIEREEDEIIETHTVCFSVTGEFLTEHFRQLVLEGAWRDAFRGLRDSCIGMTYDQAESIICGKYKLIGDSRLDNIEMVEEDPEVTKKIEEEQNWFFCGIYLHMGKHYRPYAEVTSWGAADLFHKEDHGRYLVFGSRGLEHMQYEARSLYYADNPRSDACAVIGYYDRTSIPHAILMKVVDPPPFWVRVHREHNAAYKDYMLGNGYLDTRGREEDPNNFESYLEKETNEDLETAEEKMLAEHDKMERTKAAREALQKEMEEQEAQDQLDQESYDRQVAEYRITIQARCPNPEDWILLEWEEKGEKQVLKIPKAPFINYSIWRTPFSKMAPEWEPVSHSGMKMYNDDRYHSDWMIGAGIPLERAYAGYGNEENEPFVNAVHELSWKYQNELCEFEIHVLSGKGTVTTQQVVHPEIGDEVPDDALIILPNGNVEWDDTIRCLGPNGAVILEVGGPVCHLVKVGRERDLKIIRIPNARKKFWDSKYEVTIDCDKGTMEVSPYYDHPTSMEN